MSSFICSKCGATILDNELLGYTTGCKHFPLRKNDIWKKKKSNQSNSEAGVKSNKGETK